jgi:hypothetical protein
MEHKMLEELKQWLHKQRDYYLDQMNNDNLKKFEMRWLGGKMSFCENLLEFVEEDLESKYRNVFFLTKVIDSSKNELQGKIVDLKDCLKEEIQHSLTRSDTWLTMDRSCIKCDAQRKVQQEVDKRMALWYDGRAKAYDYVLKRLEVLQELNRLDQELELQ